MTEPLDLDKLEALLSAGTPGPWMPAQRLDAGVVADNGTLVAVAVCYAIDQTLVIAAVNALPALVRIARAAMAWRDEPDPYDVRTDEAVELCEAIDAARKNGP